ncbi:HotDog domain-containing protein [Protomyces lactucae-debilis]|uniref:HotDog domain-containing protein n=1 Tax=Protomyces lactucae-debilis TaxID=2754530 RepID=A0A1Y2EW53_PROLT|nr:HotDog domain-containing protein [Protomyces lactucae-debilis]ORY75819.1 HotDog domain-containing protein [Protomyces lactucae-debilis]
MSESYVEGVLPFSTDPDSREDYINTYGGVRIAKLLEDLDALSGAISYRHADDSNHHTLPLAIVTATVDRIDLLNVLDIDRDMRLSGHVSYVGRSSMEITIRQGETHADARDGMIPIMLSRFTMVARDPTHGNAVRVNTLALSSHLEHDIFDKGRRAKEAAKEARRANLSRTAPTADESRFIHTTWARNFEIEDMVPTVRADAITPRQTQLSRAVITHPGQRNLNGHAFGGYLLAQAYDLSFITANLHLGRRPRFLSSSQLTFQNPVPIGSVLDFRSRIVAQDGSKFTITVTADKVDPETRARTTASVFHYTFSRVCRVEGSTEEAVETCGRDLVAETYGDAIRHVAARRREADSVAREEQLRIFHELRLPTV